MSEHIIYQELHKEYPRYFWQTGKDEIFTEDMKLFTLQSNNSTYALAVLGSLRCVLEIKQTGIKGKGYINEVQ